MVQVLGSLTTVGDQGGVAYSWPQHVAGIWGMNEWIKNDSLSCHSFMSVNINTLFLKKETKNKSKELILILAC